MAALCTLHMLCFVSYTAQVQHIAHIPCFARYFALFTLQYTAYSMLLSVFCTAHITGHCIFHALFYILHCSHCSTLHIPCFALYFALLTLQEFAHILCIVLYFSLLNCSTLLKADSEQKAMHTTYCSPQSLHFSFTQYLSECLVHHLK